MSHERSLQNIANVKQLLNSLEIRLRALEQEHEKEKTDLNERIDELSEIIQKQNVDYQRKLDQLTK